MTIRICFIKAAERLNFNNTVKKVQWTFDSEAENLAKRSAVTDNQHLACISKRCDTCLCANCGQSFKQNALVQSMTDSCSYFSMWRVFDTLSSRGFAIPTLRSRWSLSMGLLRFSLFEAAKKSVFYQTRAKQKKTPS